MTSPGSHARAPLPSFYFTPLGSFSVSYLSLYNFFLHLCCSFLATVTETASDRVTATETETTTDTAMAMFSSLGVKPRRDFAFSLDADSRRTRAIRRTGYRRRSFRKLFRFTRRERNCVLLSSPPRSLDFSFSVFRLPFLFYRRLRAPAKTRRRRPHRSRSAPQTETTLVRERNSCDEAFLS